MFYFSISDCNNNHLGFLVLTGEEVHNAGEIKSASGYFAVKLDGNSEHSDNSSNGQQVLYELSKKPLLLWHRHHDDIQLADADGHIIGKLHQQFLQLKGYNFLLNDLTGVI